MIQVVDVSHIEGHHLSVRFNDGTRGTVEFTTEMMRGPLKAVYDDPATFSEAFVQDGAVTWAGGFDYSPEATYALAHRLPKPKDIYDAQANEFIVSMRGAKAIAGETTEETKSVDWANEFQLAGEAICRLRHRMRDMGGDLEMAFVCGDKRIRIRGI